MILVVGTRFLHCLGENSCGDSLNFNGFMSMPTIFSRSLMALLRGLP